MFIQCSQEILPSWAKQNQLISEILRETLIFYFFLWKEEIKTWGKLPHAAPDPTPFNCLVTLSAQGSQAVWRLIKARRVPLDQLALSVAWRDISHQLTYVQLALSHTVPLCLHLPVCINHTRINLLCWREDLMKTGFSSSFLCYDTLLLGVGGVCGERHCEMRAFFFSSFIRIELIKCFDDEYQSGCFVRLK